MKLNEAFLSGSQAIVANTSKGEVLLFFASGPVSMSSKKNSPTSKVEVSITNSEYPIGGYIFTDSPVGQLISNAVDREESLLIRFEQKRKSGIDESIPINDLKPDQQTAKENTIKAVAGVYDFNNNKWILASDALSDPANDSPIVSDFINKARPNEFIDPDVFFAKSQPKLFTSDTFDKQQHLLTFYSFVKQNENKHNFKLSHDKRLMTANQLLLISDHIQKILTKSDIVDYKHYAHTKARSIVFSLVDNFIPLDENATEDLKNWSVKFLTMTKKLLEDTEKLAKE